MTTVAEALIYSGSPDPAWELSDAQFADLKHLWEQLASSQLPPQHPPGLGYRGCSLRRSSGEQWFAYHGTATYSASSGLIERRADPGRRFENALFETAPRGVVPPWDSLVSEA